MRTKTKSTKIEKIEAKMATGNFEIRLLARWGYYPNSYGAPKDGHLCEPIESTAPDKGDILAFASIQDALDYVNDFGSYSLDSQGDLSSDTAGQVPLSHGQYASEYFIIKCFKKK